MEYWCDVCGREFRGAESIRYSCRGCNWDVCARCFGDERSRTVQATTERVELQNGPTTTTTTKWLEFVERVVRERVINVKDQATRREQACIVETWTMASDNSYTTKKVVETRYTTVDSGVITTTIETWTVVPGNQKRVHSQTTTTEYFGQQQQQQQQQQKQGSIQPAAAINPLLLHMGSQQGVSLFLFLSLSHPFAPFIF